MNTSIGYYKDLIKKHFWSFLITFVLIFSLAILYAYFAQRIYLADATVEIIKYKDNLTTEQNSLQIAVKDNSPEDEAEILKSNFLINKAVEKLNLNLEFFIQKNKKHFAIDNEDLPFEFAILEIKEKKLYNSKIHVLVLENDRYQLIINNSSIINQLKNSKSININDTYKFGQVIDNEFFKIQLLKKRG